MVVYSFFLNLKAFDNYKDFSFMEDHNHCLNSDYKGFHPVIKNQDGSAQILYAMTTSKRLKKIFSMTRDMNLFTCFKSNIPDEKYDTMKKTLSSMLLKEKNLVDIDKDTKEKILVPVVLSAYEYDNIEDDLFHVMTLEHIFKQNDENDMNMPLILHDVISKGLLSELKQIKFQECLDIVSYISHDSEIEYYTPEFYDCINDLYGNVEIKTLEIFIKLYGNTLKK